MHTATFIQEFLCIVWLETALSLRNSKGLGEAEDWEMGQQCIISQTHR